MSGEQQAATDLLEEGEVQQGGDSLEPKEGQSGEEPTEGQKEGVDKDSGSDLSDGASGDLLSDDGVDGQSSGETFEFEVPDDLKDISFTDEALSAFKEVAAKAGLSQEQFQMLAEFDARNAVAAQTAAAEQHREVIDSWKQSVVTDKDIGGENLPETRQNAKAAIDKFADPELKSLLLSATEDNPDGTGLGNHPAVMKFLNRIGKALADPDFHDGEEPPKSRDTLRNMYPSMYKEEAA